MFRFTIRDVLWLTVVVAMGLCLYEDRASLADFRQRERQLRRALHDLQMSHGRLMEAVIKQKRAMKQEDSVGN